MPKKSAEKSFKEYIVKISVGNLKDVALIKVNALSNRDAETMTMKFLKVKSSLNEIL